ncbi:hypothetical protein [Bacillus sp. 03113]|uniref:hypothetical protein n=1 Tax=Bacillus sp. 03113 TaxID=2578211 RepID=UPI0015E8BA47|nr:hypothetical protein [Bacillus sp. 03113]
MNVDWNKGYKAGAKEQRDRSLKDFADLINSLDVKGVGPVLKVRIIEAINERVGK